MMFWLGYFDIVAVDGPLRRQFIIRKYIDCKGPFMYASFQANLAPTTRKLIVKTKL